MDKFTKLKVFCECEIQRVRISCLAARETYLQSLSVYDLARYHAAQTREQIEIQVLNDVLDILNHCSD